MEDEEERFRVFPAQLRGGVCLVLCEQFGVEADVPWFVYPVDVPKGSGDGEVGADSVKCLAGIRDYVQKKGGYLQSQVGNPEGADKPNKKVRTGIFFFYFSLLFFTLANGYV